MSQCKGSNISLNLARLRSPCKGTRAEPNSAAQRMALISKVAVSSSKAAREEASFQEKTIITYRKDFNIARFHREVLNRLSNHSKEVQELRERYEQLRSQSQLQQTVVERNSTLKSMEKLKAKIAILESQTRKDRYSQEARPLVLDYKKLGYRNINALEADDTDKEDDEARSRLIAMYLQVASQYINIEYIKDIPQLDECETCGYNLADNLTMQGLSMCPRCCSLRRSVVSSSQKVQSNKGPTQRGDYEDRENFSNAYLRFQCRVPFAPPESLYDDLDHYFEERNRPLSEDIKRLALEANGRKKGTDLPLLFRALHDTGYNDLYKHYMMIARDYWGWRVSNYSHLDTAIMKDYDATQAVFSRLERERSSSLSTELRVFLHIRVYDPQVRFDSFKIPGDVTSMEEQRGLWEKMCEGAKVRHIPF